MPSHRVRSSRGHVTAKHEPKVIEWASPTQAEVYNYGPYPLCASGGFGSAKTWALCLKALFLSDAFPRNRGVIARKVCKELEATTMSTFYKIADNPAMWANGRRADSEYYLRLNNGSEILFMHMEQEDIEGIIRGLEINWFLIDQAEEIEEELFDTLMTRLGRWDRTEVPAWVIEQAGGIERWRFKNPVTGQPQAPTYAMLACNPDMELHWIYRRFHPESQEHVEKRVPEVDLAGNLTGRRVSYKDLGYKMFTMSSLDNKFLPQYNRQQLLSKDKSFVDRFVFGKWGMVEGMIHQVDPLSIVPGDQDLLMHLLRTCKLGMVLDHGDAAPTCCTWWATDRDGNEWCLGEYYEPNKLISQHRMAITEMTRDLFPGEYCSWLADPSIFQKTQQKYGGRWSVADEYSDCKNLPRENALYWMPADNNELGTRNRISEYLAIDTGRINPNTKELGTPRLFFLQRSDSYPHGCYHVLRELRSQRREKIGTDLGKPIFSDDRDLKISDHAYDTVRYRIASRPAIASMPMLKRNPKSWAAVHRRYLEFKNKGGVKMLARQAEKQAMEA